MKPVLTAMLCMVYLLAADGAFAENFNPSDSLLKVGDHVPKNIMLKLLNYKQKKAPLTDFKSKLLILDFWNTHCGACYTSFPKLEKLQNEFQGELKVLLVTDESDSAIAAYFGVRKKLGAYIPPMPIAYDELQLEVLFDHRSEPHEVWLDENGKVLQITGYAELTTQNIQCVLRNGDCQIMQKNDFAVHYTDSLPLFKEGNGGNGKQIIYHSVLSEYIESAPSEAGYHSNPAKPYGEDVFGILMMNQPPISLYRMAYDPLETDNGMGQMGMPINRTFINSKDSSRYTATAAGKTLMGNLICYDLVVPHTSRDQLKKILKQDLERYFGAKATVQKRTMKCLILKMADTSLICVKGNDKPEMQIADFSINIKNTPFHRLVFWYTYRYTYPYPFIDETGIKGTVTMNFDADNSNYMSVAEALKKYNMQLTVEDRSIDVLVIQDQF